MYIDKDISCKVRKGWNAKNAKLLGALCGFFFAAFA